MRHTSLRVRLIAAFAIGALTVSGLLASITYMGVRHVLLHDQQVTDTRQAFDTANLLRSALATNPLSLPQQVSAIESDTGSLIYQRVNGQWQGAAAPGAATVSLAMLDALDAGRAASQTMSVHGHLNFVVGVPVPAIESEVVETFPLTSVQSNLSSLLRLLLLAAAFTTIVGVLIGIVVSLRTVRPLRDAATTAETILNGDLSARIAPFGGAHEVQRLAISFNKMVDQLAARIQRDSQFASDVSHELRSPLTGLSVSAAVLENEPSLTPVGRESVEILNADIAIFRALVDDLIEISRADSGAATFSLERVNAVKLIERCISASSRRLGTGEPPLAVAPGCEGVTLRVDRRRFERVIANLFDNAQNYANGITGVSVATEGDHVVLCLDDGGPGVAPEEREAIFERFYRGPVASDRRQVVGTGLGLALVRDHLSALGGTVTCDEAPGGGARFRIALPIEEVRS